MLKDIFRNYLYPSATLSGSIIGVGFLALPFITLKVGIFSMMFYFVILTAIVICVHLMFAQICLKTPDFKRWPGFVEFYFGPWAKRMVLLSMVMGGYGVLLLYLIVGSQFLAIMLSPWFGGGALVYMLLYFIGVSAVIHFGVSAVSRVSFWALVIFGVLLSIIFLTGFSKLNLTNVFAQSTPILSDWKTLFLPYGAILFSLWGTGLIPEVEEMLRGRKKTFKRVIIIGTLIPVVIYILFIFLILSISGIQTSESALIGLKDFLGSRIFFVAILIGFITTFTAFISQGLLLKKVFIYDVGISEFPAWVFTCFPPLIIFLLGFNSFISAISFIGGFLLGIDGILIILMYQKIEGKKMIAYPLMLIFVLGIIYQITIL